MELARSLGRFDQADSIQSGELEIIPVAQSFRLNWPAGTGGVLYNRPHAVLVRSEQGWEREVLIEDQTRRLQIVVLAYTALSILALWLFSRKHR